MGAMATTTRTTTEEAAAAALSEDRVRPSREEGRRRRQGDDLGCRRATEWGKRAAAEGKAGPGMAARGRAGRHPFWAGR